MSMGIAGRCRMERYGEERTKENQNYLDVNKRQVWREDFAEEAVQKRLTGAYKATILSLGGPSIQTNPWRKQCYRKTTPAVSLGQPYLQPLRCSTVKYANSEFATAAAQEIKCRKYPTLIMEEPPDSPENWTWLVFLLGTREPPDPGFDWPFGDCVLNTSAWNSMPAAFVPVFVADGNSRRVLSESEAARFKILFKKDRELSLVRSWDECRIRMREHDEPMDSRMTSSSEKGTRIPRMRGELFPRIVEISAKVDYDLSATDNFGTLNDWAEEGKKHNKDSRSFLSPVG
ncbi:hypothetical protein B0H14DRAFT_3155170 [Mycena olivaceomarginata]|nr:hypothetical protein B0H14DRAFT_3155170 [Mycena olivaceomarginata]